MIYEVQKMLENFLWAVFGILSALIGVLIVYIKNSQKILHISGDGRKINSRRNKIDKK